MLFDSDTNYYLAMEDGGHWLFQFVENIHQCIKNGQLEISEWHKLVKLIFVQMVECIEYLHSKNVCHFDISLENLLISDVQIKCSAGGKDLRFCFDSSVQVKLCDFGLAHYFENGQFLSSKFCGMCIFEPITSHFLCTSL